MRAYDRGSVIAAIVETEHDTIDLLCLLCKGKQARSDLVSLIARGYGNQSRRGLAGLPPLQFRHGGKEHSRIGNERNAEI
ncbi:MAG TPA: hypothetical protein VMB73_24295 [Acetobacteraceae bacterium]|nr:hypothetical protein [Acetobacteraceae bacterium]